MHALMYYQVIPSSVRLFTHITHVRALTTMYVLMFFQTSLLTE